MNVLYHWKVDSFLPGCDIVVLATNLDHARKLIIEELERTGRMDYRTNVNYALCLEAIENVPDEICYNYGALFISK